MKKQQWKFKIKWAERFQYEKNGYRIGSKWKERDNKGFIRYYCYAYKDKLLMKNLM